MKAITDIPNKLYQGYVWLSDQKYPTVLDKKQHDFTKLEENQFVMEALLWDAEEQISIMVRHTGTYHIQQFRLNELPAGHQLIEKAYLPHRLGDEVKNVRFKQLWVPEKDPLCENMEVMTMKALIFTGFNVSTQTK
ncbi:MAG: TIGR04423 family type III CRISPR-associated protein [Spirosomataceae bacterium]